MKLYYFPIAPNPTKVRVYLAEKGLALETERVNLREQEQRAAGFLAKNPLGKLPVLELDDGSFLSESLPIIEYLEELHPAPPLIGETPLERARVRSIERQTDQLVLQAAARLVHATASPLGLPPNPALAEHTRETLAGGLALTDERLAASAFVAGDRVTIADCTLFGALGFAEFGGVEIDPRYANVARWREAFAKRPSATLPF